MTSYEKNSDVKVLFLDLWFFQIIKRLRSKYGDLYNERNVAISGTHTHSGPGGFHQYLLYDVTSLGFVNETFVSLVEGIVAVSSTNRLNSMCL